MQFKHPEILWFLFLLVIPVIVHLFQLRRFKKEFFTNVRFLKVLSVQTRKSSVIKKYLLLATRMLLLAAAIVAFAQPYFPAADQKSASNELFIVLDNSFSMQARGSQGELLRREIENLLTDTPEDKRFSLLTNDQAFWDTDIRSIRRDLQQLSYSPTEFSLESQLARIRSKSNASKDILVITDATSSLPANVANINGFAILPEPEKKANVSVDSVYLVQTLDNFYEIGVKVSSTTAAEVPLALYNGKRLVGKTQVSVSDTESVNFTIPREDFHGYAEVADDGLSYDNRYYFSLQKPSKVKVLVVGDGAKTDFLQKIYTPDEFELTRSDDNRVDFNLLEKQDVLLLYEVKSLSSNLQQAANAFTRGGGTLVVVPASAATLEQYNQLFKPYVISLSNRTPGKKPVTRISFRHPLYSGVFTKSVDNFQYPEVNGGYLINGSVAAALSFEDGSPFLASVPTSSGAVYIFSSPLQLAETNFQKSPLVVPSFYNMAQPAARTGINAVEIGSDAALFINRAMGKEAVLTVSGAERFIPEQQVMNNRVKLRFADNPKLAGNYSIMDDASEVAKISFNYSRSESRTVRNEAMFEEFQIMNDLTSVFDKLQSERTGNELWKYFIMLALLFLILEIIIQKFVK